MTNASTGTSEPTTYALPDEPEGPVWDQHGDKWERTGDVVYAHGREWAEWQHVVTGRTGMWAAPLMRGPVTSTPPWKPVVGGIVETEEQYAALPEGSVVCIDRSIAVHVKAANGIWYIADSTSKYGSREISAARPRTILRVGWE